MCRRSGRGLVRRHRAVDPQAPAEHPLDRMLCDALSRVAADLPERWERFFSLLHAEPELKATVGAIDEANCRAARPGRDRRGCGLTADDIRVRMLAAFGNLAGRTCLEEWVLRGRPGGPQGFAAQLALAFSIIDLTLARRPSRRRTPDAGAHRRPSAAEPSRSADKTSPDCLPAHTARRPIARRSHGHPALPSRTLRHPPPVGGVGRLAGAAARPRALRPWPSLAR